VVYPAQFTTARLSCRVLDAATGRSLAFSTAQLDVLPTLWPLWHDVILVGANGVMRSARLSIAVNATAALLAAAALPAGDLAAAVASSQTVLAAAYSVWSGTSVSPLEGAWPLASGGFTLTLAGASRLVLRGARAIAAPNATQASIGGVPCVIAAISDDGVWVVVDTPTAEAVCGSTSRDCGYVPFMVGTSPPASSGLLGAVLSCPPFCPGSIGGGVVPVPAVGGDFALGVYPPEGVPAPPVLLPPSLITSSEGVYYTAACAASGLWTDPTTGACSNASDPASYNCAYGSGVHCAACPFGGLCPGGFRLWSRPGYWDATEAATMVLPCAPPDPLAKCTGWDSQQAGRAAG
jgi:hypothetical protein